MSASSTHQALDKTEPFRGVQHAKPPLKPKPIVPPRPKDISCPSPNSEIKNALLSPTCVPSSPTSDIPSALKISQLTGPQPYGTRRTSLKRWSSSVGEDATQESALSSPLESTAPDLPTKVVSQPLSSSLKPLQTGPAWKGKSPFMLTTRGWGEQRWNQGKDPHVSESASQKPSSSLTSKHRDLKTRESTSLEETPELESTSNGRFISDLGHKSIAVEAHGLKSSPTENTSHSEDVVSPGSGIHKSMEKPSQYNEIKKSQETSSLKVVSPQSDLNVGIYKQHPQYDHKDEISGQSFGSKSDDKVAQVTKPNVLVEAKEFKNEQIPNSSKTVSTTSNRDPTLGHKPFPSETSPHQVEYKNTAHHQVAPVAPDRPPRMRDLTGELYQQRINTDCKQHSQNQATASVQQSEIKYVEPTTQQDENVTPKTKDLPKPSVRFAVPSANELASENVGETQRTLDSSLSDSEQPVAQETYKHHEHGKIEIRTSTQEEHGDLSAHLQTSQRPATSVQEEAYQSSHVKCDVKEKPPFSAVTQVTDHVIYRESQHGENADTAPTHPILAGSVAAPALQAVKRLERQAADDKSDSEHEEIRAAGPADSDSLCHTEGSYGYSADDHKAVDTKLPDRIVQEERDSLNEREADARMLNEDSAPHKSELTHKQIDSPAESRSLYGKTVLPSDDSEPPSVYLQSELPEHAVTKTGPHLHMGSHVQENDSLLPEDVYIPSRESDPKSAVSKYLQPSSTETEVLHVMHSQTGKPQDDLTDLENYESKRVQDSEKVHHAANEPEEQQHQQSRLEEPFHRQSEETSNRYSQSGEPDHRYAQSKETYKQYVQSEEPIHRLEQSDESVDQYVQSEQPIHRNEEMGISYEKSEEPVHRYEHSGVPIHRYELSEEPVHHYVKSDELIHRYDQSEPVHLHVQSEEPVHRYEQSEAQVHHYVQLEEPVHRHDQSEEPVHHYVQSEEPVHHYVQSEEPFHRYEQSEEQVNHYVQSEEPIHRHDQSEEPVHHYIQSKEPVHHYVQPEESIHRYDHQSEEPVHHYVQSKEQIQSSEEQESVYKQSDAPLLKHVQSEQPVSAREQTGEPICKRAHLEEPDHQQAQSEEQHLTYTPSVNIEQSEDLQEIQHKTIQPKESEQINDMSEEKKHRITMHPGHENILMPSEVMDNASNISVEQHAGPTPSTEAEHTHKYLQQEHSYSEEHTCKDAVMPEANHKERLSKEQNQRLSQPGEPQPGHSYQEGPHTIDDPSEHIDTELDKIKSHTEVDKPESEEPQGEEPDAKHAYSERNINGHIELEDSKDSDITSDEHKLQLHTVDGSQAEDADDTTSQPEEPPEEENFDFLEGTVVLDSSCLRSRASLGKKRCRKTPISGAVTSQEEDPEYWMFRDSTDPKCCPEKESYEEEREPTSSDCTPDNSPLPRKSSKKGGIFSGIISPSILKGRLKVRHKTPEDDTSKPDSEEAKSPGKEKADSPSHSLNWLHALKKKKKKQPK